MATKRTKSPRDSNKKSKQDQKASPEVNTNTHSSSKSNIENNNISASSGVAENNMTAKPETSVTNQLGDRKEKMAAPKTNPETTEAKKANKTTESIATPAPAQKSGSGAATGLSFLAFILSVSAGGGGYWLWNQMNADKLEQASAITQLQQELKNSQQAIRDEITKTQAAIRTEASQTQQSISAELTTKSMALESMAKTIESSATAKIAAAEMNFKTAQAELGAANQNIKETKKRQESLETSLEAVYARIGNTSREWVIAEADYLLKVANHRLQLEQDVTTSIQALTLADKRINSLSDPALNEVRNVIAQELISLQTLSIPDQAGMSMQLSTLQDKVDQLPLTARTQPTHTDTTEFDANDAMKVDKWEALPVAILDVLKGMVSVNYNDKPMEPLLTPEQVRNLHENLKLKLEQARMVLLRGDEKLYAANIDLAIDWTSKHFNNDEVSTRKFIDTLKYLKTQQVALKTPDISSSLRTLRKVSKRLDMNLPSISGIEASKKNTDLAMIQE